MRNSVIRLSELVRWNYSEVQNMENYKNSYTENEDKILWALHEIRHELHEERRNKTIEEINREALQIYSGWRNERDNKITVTDKAEK